MADTFLLTLAQLNPTVGDLTGNCANAFTAWQGAKADGADMVMLPEMFVTGYQTQDLITKAAFVSDAMGHINRLAAQITDGLAMGIGGPYTDETGRYNAYYILQDGGIKTIIKKHCLPRYTVFDEPRLFDITDISGPYAIGPLRIGSPICEDAWHEEVSEALVESGAQVLFSPNGSPYERGKMDLRLSMAVARSLETDLPIVYLNMVGGQDDQPFDGGSFVINPGGKLAASLPVFEESIQNVRFTETDAGWRAEVGERAVWPDAVEQDYCAVVMALRDYVLKSGFSSVILGLSGGVDSALVAAIAADALGAAKVHCVMMPSEFTSDTSLSDAAAVAQALGAPLRSVPIAAAQKAVNETLAPEFAGAKLDVTEENIQSRLRGLMLMAMSNKFGHMLLTTGNKSEVAVGYATIYGDMAGGYNPIKDLYKTDVFAICRWRNAHHRDWMQGPAGQVISQGVIDKPPSAELRADQKDEDSLPPYDILDGILRMLVDKDASVADCMAAGFDRGVVKKIEHLLYISEYKRFQSAPGVRLTNRALWLDRRYPIVNKWRDESGRGD